MVLSMERFARRVDSVDFPPGQPFLTSQFNIGTLDFGKWDDRSAFYLHYLGDHPNSFGEPPARLQCRCASQ